MEFQAALLAHISPQELVSLDQTLLKLRAAALEFQSAQGRPEKQR
jgi:hypothetical protein